jgi:DsbC/DsbD-like thiol-disulfide interchange protein/cytochrome c biogenesis protein CcdA
MSGLSRLFAVLLALFLVAPAVAQPMGDAQHIRPRLTAETLTPAAGQNVTIAIVMATDKGWHGYWSNPGEAGYAPRLSWQLPQGLTLSAPRYPVPRTFVLADLMNYVFEDDHALLFDLSIPKGQAPGTLITLRLKAEWLACSDTVCIPERGEFTLNLTIGDGARTPSATFDAYRRALPVPLGAPVSFARERGALRLAIPFPRDTPIDRAHFFPAKAGLITDAAAQRFSRQGDILIATIPTKNAALPVEGVLSINDERGFQITAVPGTVPPDATPIGDDAPSSLAAIFWALGGAILGGVILNVMPCVFPIVSLKALSLARAGGDERAAKREALAYTAGVIATCVALGGIILAARAAGTQLGWAFQLQNPTIVFVLLFIATGITLNLAGMFNLNALGFGQSLVEKGGTKGAFWTGVLAAFVATPCTGPFMAAALGAALVLPLAASLTVFFGLGLGIALPFLAIGFIPALRRRLPKPGAWMATFERVLAVPMALTVVALLWLIDRSQGALAFQWAVIAVLLTIIGTVIAGRRPTAPVGIALAMVLLLGVSAIKWPRQANVIAAAPFTEPALASARGKGQPVFLYFTADWCLTCKVNERTVLDRAEVQAAFKRRGVTVMSGDWTHGDPAITRFLQSKGAFGVPLYLYYRPGVAEPEILPQILTPGSVIALTNA